MQRKRVIKRFADNPRFVVLKVYGLGLAEYYQFETLLGAFICYMRFYGDNREKKLNWYEERLQEYGVIYDFERMRRQNG